MDSDHLSLGIPHGASAGAACPVECGVNVTGVPVTFVNVEVCDSPEFDRIFLFLVIPDQQEFHRQGTVNPIRRVQRLAAQNRPHWDQSDKTRSRASDRSRESVLR